MGWVGSQDLGAPSGLGFKQHGNVEICMRWQPMVAQCPVTVVQPPLLCKFTAS